MALSGDEKLRALGLKLPSSEENPYEQDFLELRNALNEDYGTFSTDLDGLSSFDEFESYLINDQGLSAEAASNLRQNVEQRYGDYLTFTDSVSAYDSFESWEATFNYGRTFGGDIYDAEGNQTSGIRVHSQNGVSREGVSVPAGTVEVFGPRVEFSQTGAPAASTSSPVFNVYDLYVSTTTPDPGETVAIAASVENTGGQRADFTFVLTEDGTRVDSHTVSVSPGGVKRHQFTRTYTSYVSVEVLVNDLGPETVTVQHPNIV